MPRKNNRLASTNSYKAGVLMRAKELRVPQRSKIDRDPARLQRTTSKDQQQTPDKRQLGIGLFYPVDDESMEAIDRVVQNVRRNLQHPIGEKRGDLSHRPGMLLLAKHALQRSLLHATLEPSITADELRDAVFKYTLRNPLPRQMPLANIGIFGSRNTDDGRLSIGLVPEPDFLSRVQEFKIGLLDMMVSLDPVFTDHRAKALRDDGTPHSIPHISVVYLNTRNSYHPDALKSQFMKEAIKEDLQIGFACRRPHTI